VTNIVARRPVKRIDTPDGEGLLLRFNNREFAPIIRLGDDANRVTIQGRVIWSGNVW
jgi:phage repressor protein C with HTH and peptisase S24 domain